jgi:predicted N-acyltransferase
MNESLKTLWKSCQSALNPFLRYEFHESLRESGSICAGSGWDPVHVVDEMNKAILLCYLKHHSYGEYIFDWGWAEAYARSGLEYYPKFTSMIPFTPVTTSHFLMREDSDEIKRGLLTKLEAVFDEMKLSSLHFLFLSPSEIPLFQSSGYLIRESMQYHFFNQDYHSFEDFLSSLKSRKAKHIRQERIFTGLRIERLTGKNLTTDHAREMYEFYLSTIDKKSSYGYLTRNFFERIFASMPENILYVRASSDVRPIAGALFFYDQERLYGRYWGAHEYVENLHFELCYYQGIDFTLERKLKVFEAGAQGEHKIQRGFRPTKTFSAHKIRHPGFSRAIEHFINEEKSALAEEIKVLETWLPFKT